jgi:hypothetical protein
VTDFDLAYLTAERIPCWSSIPNADGLDPDFRVSIVEVSLLKETAKSLNKGAGYSRILNKSAQAVTFHGSLGKCDRAVDVILSAAKDLNQRAHAAMRRGRLMRSFADAQDDGRSQARLAERTIPAPSGKS